MHRSAAGGESSKNQGAKVCFYTSSGNPSCTCAEMEMVHRQIYTHRTSHCHLCPWHFGIRTIARFLKPRGVSLNVTQLCILSADQSLYP